MKKAAIAACAAAVGVGAGLLTGTAVASADVDVNPSEPPADSTGLLGPVLGAVDDIAAKAPKPPRPPRDLEDIPVVKSVDQATTSLLRIATNHSLTTARLV